MDGQLPSGFTDQQFWGMDNLSDPNAIIKEAESEVVAAEEEEVQNLGDVFVIADGDVWKMITLFYSNMWVVFVWW